MGKKRIKHLGKNKKILSKLKLYSKKISITGCVLLSIVALFLITKDLETKELEEKKEIELSLDKDKTSFIKSIEKGAKKSYKKYGIYPSVTIAQAILESGWGQSKLATESNNIFGIKADISWNGDYVEVITSENYDDTITAKFRKYEDINKSIEDHAKFLVENPRYEEYGVFKAKNYKDQAQALEDAGYSTKQNKSGEFIYADMLIDIIKRYGLHKIDKIYR
ncbi:glycoside hydrolase family 73 protein [Romboutsia lituseburensis]|uniref:glycoside hydrolase family 73 protein n=1 Tax=Romboutsia lituseburensis TaxID=1537 RepID=UPI00215A8110|nr:glucosaminidase domain-containing protein [Romboutsia lituseburensis]MCR8746422.1 glucosaminidase domain-containing protein [Romboutsia lituseburensis]